MFDLSYFNLGFRSDSVSNSLVELKNNKIKNDDFLNEGLLLIGDCLKLKDKDALVSNLSANKGYEIQALFPLIGEIYTGRDYNSVIHDLKNIFLTIKKALSNKKIMEPEFEQAIRFFSMLSDLCLSKSANQSYADQLS